MSVQYPTQLHVGLSCCNYIYLHSPVRTAVTRIQADRHRLAQTNKQRQTYDFKDRWIQKLTDDWPGSTQTEVSFKSTCSEVTFQFYIRRGSTVPSKSRSKSTYWGSTPTSIHGEHGRKYAPAYNGQRVRGTKIPEADDIYLFQRIISLKNYHINLGNLDYIASMGAHLRQNITVRGSEGRSQWRRQSAAHGRT